MTVPVPRPPGAWKALARDALLNPEEKAARAAALAAPTEPALDPAEDLGAEMPKLTPEQRLIRFQALIDRAGWKMSFVFDADSARIEAFHPSRAAVMVTAKAGRDAVYSYVLIPKARGVPRWQVVRHAAIEHFLTHQTLPSGTRSFRVANLCHCTKQGRFPTEAYAKLARTDIQIRNTGRGRPPAPEGRVYRCPTDQRVWHVTRLARWRRPSKPQPSGAAQ
ncbi:hypothetical protein [Streptomyces sp. 1222.5]|uniref:hypothetical protein n=1 Tax=Streptomyces sp. 1222.5 TaxID=1881026 RepID=UPI003D753D3D